MYLLSCTKVNTRQEKSTKGHNKLEYLESGRRLNIGNSKVEALTAYCNQALHGATGTKQCLLDYNDLRQPIQMQNN